MAPTGDSTQAQVSARIVIRHVGWKGTSPATTRRHARSRAMRTSRGPTPRGAPGGSRSTTRPKAPERSAMSTAGHASLERSGRTTQIDAEPSSGSTHGCGSVLARLSTTRLGSPSRLAWRAQLEVRATRPEPGAPRSCAVSPGARPPARSVSSSLQPEGRRGPGTLVCTGTAAPKSRAMSARSSSTDARLGVGSAIRHLLNRRSVYAVDLLDQPLCLGARREGTQERGSTNESHRSLFRRPAGAPSRGPRTRDSQSSETQSPEDFRDWFSPSESGRCRPHSRDLPRMRPSRGSMSAVVGSVEWWSPMER